MEKLHVAEKLLEQGGVLLDIRTGEEYAKGHLCGSHNIPTPLPPLNREKQAQLLHQLQYFMRRSNVRPNTPIIVYCKKGIRAAEACCQLLQKLGMKRVMNLGGVLDEPLKGIMSGRIRSKFLKRCPAH